MISSTHWSALSDLSQDITSWQTLVSPPGPATWVVFMVRSYQETTSTAWGSTTCFMDLEKWKTLWLFTSMTRTMWLRRKYGAWLKPPGLCGPRWRSPTRNPCSPRYGVSDQWYSLLHVGPDGFDWTTTRLGFIITHLCSFVSKVVFVSICKNFWDCGLVAIDDITVSVGDCQITAGNRLS